MAKVGIMSCCFPKDTSTRKSRRSQGQLLGVWVFIREMWYKAARLDALDGHQGDDRSACLPVAVDCAGYIFEIIVVSIAECAHIKESN